jgi:hypothetical protein
MGSRPSALEIVWEEGAEAFAFLVDDWDFIGPERTDSGIAFHRPDLHVVIELWEWKNEAGFSTYVRHVDVATGQQQAAGLGDLYVTCELGPAQDVTENLGGGHTVAKRVAQHAAALRLLMPYLSGPEAGRIFRSSWNRGS